MHISVQDHFDFDTGSNQVTVEVTQPAPYARFLEHLIFMAAHSHGADVEHLAVGDVLTLRLRAIGPFALSMAERFISRFCSSFDDQYAQLAKTPEDTAMKPGISLELRGAPVPSVEVFSELVKATPSMEYKLGDFELTQENMRVTDPCYDKSTWCTGTFKALPGAWHAKTEVGPTSWHFRVKALQVCHESLGDLPIQDYHSLTKTDIDAGVDSGQCGFFDDKLFPDDKSQLEYEDDTFYGGCCAATLDDNGPGGGVVHLLPKDAQSPIMGAVSSSGFGDGSYDVYVRKNEHDQVVLALLVYIGDDEDESEEDEEDSDD